MKTEIPPAKLQETLEKIIKSNWGDNNLGKTMFQVLKYMRQYKAYFAQYFTV